MNKEEYFKEKFGCEEVSKLSGLRIEDVKRELDISLKVFIDNQMDKLSVIGVKNTSVSFYQYLDFINRIIPVQPYSLFDRTNNDLDGMPSSVKMSFEEICNKIINSEDINPYLSKTIFKIQNPKKKLVKTDYLQALFGIGHLHLSTKKDKNNPYFYERSDYLLFITIEESNINLIGIIKHPKGDKWINNKNININLLKKRYPEFINEKNGFHEVGGFGKKPALTTYQHMQYGSCPPIESNNSSYISINSVTSSGMPTYVLNSHDTLMHSIRNIVIDYYLKTSIQLEIKFFDSEIYLFDDKIDKKIFKIEIPTLDDYNII